MSAVTAPGARDVDDDTSAEKALATVEALIDADPLLASSEPVIGPALPPAVSRGKKRARPPPRAPDGERMHPRNVFAASNPDFAAQLPRLLRAKFTARSRILAEKAG